MRKFCQAAIVLILAIAAPAFAQSDAFLSQYRERLAKKPPDLKVELQTADGRTRFQTGEVIRLDLTFSATGTTRYTFNNRSYDRGGRLHMDDFVLDRPSDIVDPLDDFYGKNFGGFVMGGIFSTPTLGRETVHYELNEYMRLEKPGKYRLYIASPRVTIGPAYGEGAKYMNAVSNTIEFEIIPAEAAWQEETLTRNVKTLDSPAPETEQRKACEALRYLGTEGAAREMVRRYTDEEKNRTCLFDFQMGLYGSPARTFIVGEMERKMRAPEFPVSVSFLYTLGRVSFFLKSPPFPPYVPPGDEAALKQYEAEMQKIQKVREDELAKYAAMLEAALKDKKPAAVPDSLYTLFDSGNVKNIEITETIAGAFPDLSEEKQRLLLQYKWERFVPEKMLPLLRKVLARYDTGPEASKQVLLRDIAIKRILEVAPAEGRQLVLAEMVRPTTRVFKDLLTILPDKEIPELDDLLIKRATDPSTDYTEREMALVMLERYGGPKAVEPLRQVYEDRIGTMECANQKSVIFYFLKNRPETGLKMLDRALGARAKTGCYRFIFPEFDPKLWSAEVERIALSYLDDDNIGVVTGIVKALGKSGSADVKDKIWQRFARFSAGQKKADTGANADFSSPYSVEQAFVEALTGSPNWKLGKEELARLGELCRTNNCRSDVENATQRPVN